jgi:hypothetical protein
VIYLILIDIWNYLLKLSLAVILNKEVHSMFAGIQDTTPRMDMDYMTWLRLATSAPPRCG